MIAASAASFSAVTVSTFEEIDVRKADLEDVFIDLMAGEQTPLEVAR